MLSSTSGHHHSPVDSAANHSSDKGKLPLSSPPPSHFYPRGDALPGHERPVVPALTVHHVGDDDQHPKGISSGRWKFDMRTVDKRSSTIKIRNFGSNPDAALHRRLTTERRRYVSANADYRDHDDPVSHVGRDAEEVTPLLYLNHSGAPKSRSKERRERNRRFRVSGLFTSRDSTSKLARSPHGRTDKLFARGARQRVRSTPTTRRPDGMEVDWNLGVHPDNALPPVFLNGDDGGMSGAHSKEPSQDSPTKMKHSTTVPNQSSDTSRFLSGFSSWRRRRIFTAYASFKQEHAQGLGGSALLSPTSSTSSDSSNSSVHFEFEDTDEDDVLSINLEELQNSDSDSVSSIDDEDELSRGYGWLKRRRSYSNLYPDRQRSPVAAVPDTNRTHENVAKSFWADSSDLWPPPCSPVDDAVSSREGAPVLALPTYIGPILPPSINRAAQYLDFKTTPYLLYTRDGIYRSDSFSQLLAPTANGSHAASGDSPVSGSWLERTMQEGTVWLDCCGPTDADLQLLAGHFRIHPLTLSTILSSRPNLASPKHTTSFPTRPTSSHAAHQESYSLLHIHPLCLYEFSPQYLQPLNLFILIFHDARCVVTIHWEVVGEIGRGFGRLRGIWEVQGMNRQSVLENNDTADGPRLGTDSGRQWWRPEWVAYLLVEDHLSSFHPILTHLHTTVDDISELVLYNWEDTLDNSNSGMELLKRIHRSRKRVTMLGRMVGETGVVLKGFHKKIRRRMKYSTPNIGVADEEITLYFDGLIDRSHHIHHTLSEYDSTLSKCHTDYLAVISVALSESSKRGGEATRKMTAMVTLLVPLGVLTGVMG
ncbi:CorA metal ion transporter [Gaertneriomyces sp. JEL0708]|nr:CorA metal ion transporter [Gaertneriomyces sp. JEL0708]